MPDTPLHRAAVLAIVALGFLAYGNTLTADFVWDDVSSVLVHESVKTGRFFQLFQEDQHAYMGGQGNFYRPLVAASFMLDFALAYDGPGGEGIPRIPDVSPFFFHLSSVIWHILAAVFLYLLLSAVGAPFFVAFASAGLYAIHPLHTEAVAYVSGRADSMAAAFMFAGMASAVWFQRKDRRYVAWTISTLCFAGALLSKESAAIYPLLLAIVLWTQTEWTLREKPTREHLRPMTAVLPAVVILAMYTALRSTLLRFPSDTQPTDISFGSRLLDTGQALALYIKLIFAPANLHMERTLDGVPAWAGFAGFMVLALIIAGIVLAVRRDQKRIAAGLAWFLVTWFPISGIIPLNAPMAEHWMYVPLAGFLWAVMESLWRAAQRGLPRAAITVPLYAAGIALLAITVNQNKAWQNDVVLYESILEHNPESMRANYNLAVAYESVVGNRAGARRHFQKTLELFQQRKVNDPAGAAERFWDQELEAHLSLGRILVEEGKYNQAAGHFQTLLRVTPTETTRPVISTAAYHYGRMIMDLRSARAALPLFQEALRGRPDLTPEVQRLVAENFVVSHAEPAPADSP